MSTIYCNYLKKEAKALDSQPWPGEIGTRIQQEISAEAWQLWLKHQTMLINEKRLSPRKREDRDYLESQMIAFLYGGEVDQAEGYKPINNND